jgi:hypothetical protein
MNRALILGIAMVFAVVGIALIGGESNAVVAGHGCHACGGCGGCGGGGCDTSCSSCSACKGCKCGGLLARMRARRAARGCCAPACCAPAPACCCPPPPACCETAHAAEEKPAAKAADKAPSKETKTVPGGEKTM